MAIYNGKHCVFEMVGVESQQRHYNESSNIDVDGYYNNWNISDLRNTYLPRIILLLSSILQDNLTNTTIQTATNGMNGILASTSDKLFLAAEKEMTASPSYALSQENNVLITWTYWTTHTQQSDKTKYEIGTTTNRGYWLRSPASGNDNNIVKLSSLGQIGILNAYGNNRFSPCFAF